MLLPNEAIFKAVGGGVYVQAILRSVVTCLKTSSYISKTIHQRGGGGVVVKVYISESSLSALSKNFKMEVEFCQHFRETVPKE